MDLFGTGHGGGGGGKKTTLPKHWPDVSYNDQTWHRKYINHVNHVIPALISIDISIFSPKISKFCYINKYIYRLNFNA